MNGKLTVRRVASKRKVLRDLHRATFPHDIHPDYDIGRWWVAKIDGEPVAFAGTQPSHQFQDTVYLVRCGVLPHARGLGLQKRLIKLRLADAKRNGAKWAVTTTYNNPVSSNSLISLGFKLYEPANPWGADGTLYWRKALDQ